MVVASLRAPVGARLGIGAAIGLYLLQRGLHRLVARPRRPRQRLGARALERLVAVPVGQSQQRPRRPVRLLLHLPRLEDAVDDRQRGFPLAGGAAAEPVPAPLGPVPVRVGHMGRIRDVGALRTAAAPVQRDALPVAGDGHRVPGGDDGHFAPHIGERHRVVALVKRHVVVKLDGGGLPDRHLVRSRRQGLEEVLLLAEEDLPPASGPLLERGRVHGVHRLLDRLGELAEADERPVPERGDDPALHDAHAHLDGRLVLGSPHPRRHHGAAVVLRHAPVLLVDHQLLDGVAQDARLAVVGDEDRRRAAELAERPDMAVDPGLLAHVGVGPCEYGRREGQARHEHVGLAYLAGVGIAPSGARPGPVDLHLLGWPPIDVHGDGVASGPLAMALAEGGVHEGLRARVRRPDAVLAPQQRHRDAGAAHLPLDPLVVDGVPSRVDGGLRR